MKKFALSALALALLFACGGDDPPVTPDAGPVVDADIPDPPPPPPPPPQEVQIAGKVAELGSYLAGNTQYIDGVPVLALGVSPVQDTVSAADGAYSLTAPANGQIVFFANKLGYYPSYTSVTTQQDNIVDRKLYITDTAWLNAIADTHGVDLNNPFPCHEPALDPATNCIYGVAVGRILDDGAQNNGTRTPVGGVTLLDFQITGGPNADSWYVKGPYFLEPDGTPNANATSSIVVDNGNGYEGGLYITFIEVPLAGPEVTDVQLQISYNDQDTGVARQFGPKNVQLYRGYGVTWTNLYETGVVPPPPPGLLDFDTQIYPLFLPVNQGGYGCQGCHTNQQDAVPAGGMNLYGGPEAAYESLNPETYPQRVNLDSPDASYLLTKPLYEPNGVQNHAIFAFTSQQDPGYQLIRQWIAEGATRVGNLPPVSFRQDVVPLLAEPAGNGGAGCYNCHVNGVNADTAPGGFYMGGTPEELWAEIVTEAPNDNGGTGEAYRINRAGVPEYSLLLTNPLFGNAEPHPTKIFPANVDYRYALLYRWIVEGYVDDGL